MSDKKFGIFLLCLVTAINAFLLFKSIIFNLFLYINFLLIGGFFKPLLFSYLRRTWYYFSGILSKIFSPFILTILYITIFFPLNLILKILYNNKKFFCYKENTIMRNKIINNKLY